MSVRSLRSLSGVCQESIRSQSGVRQVYLKSLSVVSQLSVGESIQGAIGGSFGMSIRGSVGSAAGEGVLRGSVLDPSGIYWGSIGVSQESLC